MILRLEATKWRYFSSSVVVAELYIWAYYLNKTKMWGCELIIFKSSREKNSSFWSRNQALISLSIPAHEESCGMEELVVTMNGERNQRKLGSESTVWFVKAFVMRYKRHGRRPLRRTLKSSIGFVRLQPLHKCFDSSCSPDCGMTKSLEFLIGALECLLGVSYTRSRCIVSIRSIGETS